MLVKRAIQMKLDFEERNTLPMGPSEEEERQKWLTPEVTHTDSDQQVWGLQESRWANPPYSPNRGSGETKCYFSACDDVKRLTLHAEKQTTGCQ